LNKILVIVIYATREALFSDNDLVDMGNMDLYVHAAWCADCWCYKVIHQPLVTRWTPEYDQKMDLECVDTTIFDSNVY
jgi:hypothetical protein